MTREVKVVTCCPESRFCPREGKNHRKIPVQFFCSEFSTQRALYNHETFVCSEFFYLSCRSIPKKFFTTCWSVFHRFCPVLPFLRFANLKLAFSLQKLFGNLEKKYPFKNILISSREKLFYMGTNLANQIMMSYV